MKWIGWCVALSISCMLMATWVAWIGGTRRSPSMPFNPHSVIVGIVTIDVAIATSAWLCAISGLRKANRRRALLGAGLGVLVPLPGLIAMPWLHDPWTRLPMAILGLCLSGILLLFHSWLLWRIIRVDRGLEASVDVDTWGKDRAWIRALISAGFSIAAVAMGACQFVDLAEHRRLWHVVEASASVGHLVGLFLTWPAFLGGQSSALPSPSSRAIIAVFFVIALGAYYFVPSPEKCRRWLRVLDAALLTYLLLGVVVLLRWLYAL